MSNEHHEAIPDPDIAVQAALENLPGDAVHVVDGHVQVEVPTVGSLTPEQRDYIRSRRDQRAKHAARLTILRQTATFSSRSQVFESDED